MTTMLARLDARAQQHMQRRWQVHALTGFAGLATAIGTWNPWVAGLVATYAFIATLVMRKEIFRGRR